MCLGVKVIKLAVCGGEVKWGIDWCGVVVSRGGYVVVGLGRDELILREEGGFNFYVCGGMGICITYCICGVCRKQNFKHGQAHVGLVLCICHIGI